MKLTVVDYAETGEGIAFDPSVKGPIFLPGAIQGEELFADVDKKSKLGTNIDVITPSIERIDSRCKHFGVCGGCDWQHLGLDAQHASRVASVKRALPARFRTVPIDTVQAKHGYGYRTRARLSWSNLSIDGKSTELGHRARRTNTVVDATECPILHHVLESALSTLREALAVVGGRGTVFLSKSSAGPVATLRADQGLSIEGYRIPDWLVNRGFAGVELYSPGATVPVRAGDPRPVITAHDGRDLIMSPEGFAQANDEMNHQLVAHVLEQSHCRDKHILELYAGAGNFTVALAPLAASVTTVESDRGAVQAQRENLALRGIKNVASRDATAMEGLQSKAARSVIILDPPRTGALDECKAIVAKPCKRVVYVSCDPATFGRDLEVLAGVYTLERLTAFAMFPQTAHCELVAVFSKRVGSDGAK